ncbi:hypothetical protein BHE74_00053279, partial [Ensete ventricosum]
CNVVDKDDIEKVVKTVKRAIKVYGTPAFARMIQNGMKQDLSWKGPAKKWEQFLMSLGATGSEPGIDGEEIAPLAIENMATPSTRNTREESTKGCFGDDGSPFLKPVDSALSFAETTRVLGNMISVKAPPPLLQRAA